VKGLAKLVPEPQQRRTGRAPGADTRSRRGDDRRPGRSKHEPVAAAELWVGITKKGSSRTGVTFGADEPIVVLHSGGIAMPA
jgi:hypothetical protein